MDPGTRCEGPSVVNYAIHTPRPLAGPVLPGFPVMMEDQQDEGGNGGDDVDGGNSDLGEDG